MIQIPLTMRYGHRPQREPQAWYLAGKTPAAWLAEIARWDLCHSEVRLLPIPLSSTNRHPQGVLLLPPDGTIPAASQQCVPYGTLADRLLLPVEAWLDPHVEDDELRLVLASGYSYVWHPVAGLVAFEPRDVLSPSDLLAPSAPRSRRWDLARPGVTLARQLVSVLPEATPTIDMVFESGQDDIGAESEKLSELPASPLEPKPGLLSEASRYGKRTLASIVQWLTQLAPATSDVPTWINQLEQWAEKQLANFQAGVSAERNKEILRLLDRLKNDPDQGLRYALPLGGDAHRGLAPPGNQLPERNTDFDLGRLGGGQAADFWDVSSDYQFQLAARYRELANREIHLGRHRRAAYIFAELLSDYASAARALEAGRHWREAAVLYRDRLKQPRDAARCLEQGGLWMEAIDAYEDLGEYEKAGDLYVSLGQKQNANTQYQRALDMHRANGDFLSSARLLEAKLGSVDGAIAELASAWPHSPQAGKCLRKLFETFGRVGRHTAASEWIDQLRESATSEPQSVELAEVLAQQAADYPDRRVRELASDSTRVLVSRQIATVSESERRKLVSTIGRLVPEDRLLRRDCQRFLEQYPRIATPAVRSATPQQATLIRTLRLPGHIDWRAVTQSEGAIFVAGTADDELFLLRSNLKEVDLPGKSWRIPPHLSESSILLMTERNGSRVYVHLLKGPGLLTSHTFRKTDSFPFETTAGSFAGLDEGVVAASWQSRETIWMLTQGVPSGLSLHALGPSGELISTQAVPSPRSFHPPRLPIPLHARRETVYVGLDKQLLVLNKDQSVETVEFSQSITSLVGSAPHTRSRIAVAFPHGAKLLWNDFGDLPSETVSSDMVNPVVGFNRGGLLIVACQGQCEVYSTQQRTLKLQAKIRYKFHPIAIVAAAHSGQFGIVSQGGHIEIYQIGK